MCSRFRTQIALVLLHRMLGDPRSGSKAWKAPDCDIGKSGKNRCQVVANGDFQPTAAFHDRENRRDFWPCLWAAYVDPVLPTKSDRTHRILRQVIAQFKFWIFQESGKFLPKRESVVAGVAECAGGQCAGLRCFDPLADLVHERFGYFLTQSMTPSKTNYSSTSFRVDGKQFVHPRHNRSCNQVSWI